MSRSEVKLSVQHLSHSFGSFRALQDVTLDIRHGEFVCILGASGCGKSTLFNAVSGLLRITEGRVLLDGRDIAGRPGEVGYMLQKDLLLPWRTVLGNITLGASLTHGATREDRAKAAELARRYGLGDFLRHFPRALSGGMRQRVALMRTIAAGREVMLLDEPFGALDSQTRIGMQQWLLQVWKELSRTVIFVTHDVDEAIFLADRIVLMQPRPGRIAKILQVEIPRPRAMDVLTSPVFVETKRQIMDMLYSEQTLHGVPAAAELLA
jgi:ABC-type nitrate/sulfonate/bicarbonate transport system ATPase subunit